MCKINKMEVRKAIANKGMNLSDISREIGRDSNYMSVALNKGKMPEKLMEKLCFILDADKEKLTRVYSEFEQYTLHGETIAQGAVRKQKNTKKFYTPIEIEKLFDELRVGVNEDDAMAAAEMSKVKLGEVTSMCVPLSCVHFAKWQRNTRINKAKEIAETFKPWACDKPKAFFDSEGKLRIVDGNHRVLAHYYNKLPYIWVELIENAREEDVIDMFLMQDVRRTKMSPDDMYRASIENKIVLYTEFRNTAISNNLQIKADDELISEPNGSIKPTITMLRLSNSKPVLFDKALKLINELEWKYGANAYCYRNIRTLIDLLEKHSTDIPSVEEKLKAKCFGADFYENVVKKEVSREKLYDRLIMEMNR